jgi:hypothetical protein
MNLACPPGVESGRMTASSSEYDLCGGEQRRQMLIEILRMFKLRDGLMWKRASFAATQLHGRPSYNAAGNLLNDGALSYTYDALVGD